MLKVSKHHKAAAFFPSVRTGIENGLKAVGPVVKDLAVPIAATAATTIGIPMVAGWVHNRAVDKEKQKYQTELVNSYQGMLDVHPALKERDPVRVQRMFNTLSRVNPTIASDPNAAGAYIRRALDEDHLDTGAGTIALVDMASRFDSSKARVDFTGRINPMLRAENVSSMLRDFNSEREKGKARSIAALRAHDPDMANQLYGPDPDEVKRERERAARQAERAEDRQERDHRHQQQMELLKARLGRR